jgi:hypothetical protein
VRARAVCVCACGEVRVCACVRVREQLVRCDPIRALSMFAVCVCVCVNELRLRTIDTLMGTTSSPLRAPMPVCVCGVRACDPGCSSIFVSM